MFTVSAWVVARCSGTIRTVQGSDDLMIQLRGEKIVAKVTNQRTVAGNISQRGKTISHSLSQVRGMVAQLRLYTTVVSRCTVMRESVIQDGGRAGIRRSGGGVVMFVRVMFSLLTRHITHQSIKKSVIPSLPFNRRGISSYIPEMQSSSLGCIATSCATYCTPLQYEGTNCTMFLRQFQASPRSARSARSGP